MGNLPSIPIAFYKKESLAVKKHEEARDRAEYLQELAKSLSKRDYDKSEVVDTLDEYSQEKIYTYHLPDGELFIDAVCCCGDEFAEIYDATLQVGDDEFDLLPYVKYMQ